MPGKSNVREVLEAIGSSPTGMTDERDAVALLDIHLGRVQACNDAQALTELVDVRDGAKKALNTTFKVRTTSQLARSHADPLVNALAPLERLIENMQKEELARSKGKGPKVVPTPPPQAPIPDSPPPQTPPDPGGIGTPGSTTEEVARESSVTPLPTRTPSPTIEPDVARSSLVDLDPGNASAQLDKFTSEVARDLLASVLTSGNMKVVSEEQLAVDYTQKNNTELFAADSAAIEYLTTHRKEDPEYFDARGYEDVLKKAPFNGKIGQEFLEAIRAKELGDAKAKLIEGKSRGFTAPDGEIYVLDGGKDPEGKPSTDHDKVHETVHLMSASGGLTKIKKAYGDQVNEGFTEYFTKRMCKELGVSDCAAYPQWKFIQRVERVVGYPALYKAYMQDGGPSDIIGKLADLWMSKADSFPPNDGKAHPDVPNSNRGRNIRALEGKLRNNGLPTGADRFWDVLL